MSLVKVSYKAGDSIFREGDPSSDFYIVESGEIHILTKDKANQTLIVAKLFSGDTFGEFALIDHSPRSASAIAKTDSKVMRISQESYETMLNDLPIWASSMLKSLTGRIIHMNSTIKNLTETLSKHR